MAVANMRSVGPLLCRRLRGHMGGPLVSNPCSCLCSRKSHGMAFMQAAGPVSGCLSLVSQGLFVQLGWLALIVSDLSQRPQGTYWQAC